MNSTDKWTKCLSMQFVRCLLRYIIHGFCRRTTDNGSAHRRKLTELQCTSGLNYVKSAFLCRGSAEARSSSICIEKHASVSNRTRDLLQ